MSTSTVEQKVRTPEEIAAIEAERARQQAIFSDAKAEVAKEKEDKENRFQKALIQRKAEQDAQPQEQTVNSGRQGIIFSKEQIDSIQQNALAEIEIDHPTISPLIEHIQTPNGEFLPSIPLFSLPVEDSWERVSMTTYQPEITRYTNGLLEIVQSERNLQVAMERRDNGDIHVQFTDLNDRYPQTRIKLSGTLHEENGRMTYTKDEDVFFHFSSLVMVDQNLIDLSTVVNSGVVSDITYPENKLWNTR